MNRYIIAAAVGFGATASLAAAGASAESLPAGEERLKVVAGWFLPAFKTDVRIDDVDNVGDDISLGDDLGVDEDQSGGLLGFEWRIAERHRLGASWSHFSQGATRVIDREISIGDEVYPIDATVETEWSLDLIPITYSYSFVQNEKNEFAATFGVHWNSISLKLAGSSSLSDDDLDAETDSSADLPLPLLGIRYDHHFSDSWSAGIGAAFFSIEFGEDELDASGSLYNVRAYAEYRFKGRFGAGLAVDAFRLDIEADKPRLTGEYVYDYWGPQLYLIARF